MRLSNRRRNTQVRLNMTPMIDIVFLLIIFFMTVSQVSKVNREQIDLPKLKGSGEQQETVVIININQAGDIVVSGINYSLRQLITLLGDELEAVGRDPRRLTVSVRADERGKSGPVNEVVAALSELQINRINIRVLQPR